MKYQQVKVTTTPNIDGAKIIEYIEPVTAHVVVGMNFMKDILSSFTDFFGGNSQTYQETLGQINEAAIDELKKKTFSLGGNCIVGLKIDNDEISAQGKSMLMVTAIGTAVNVEFANNAHDQKTKSRLSVISNANLNILKRKTLYIQALNNNSLKTDDEFWDFAIKNKVEEFADKLLIKYIDYVGTNTAPSEFIEKNIISYFNVIDSEIAVKSLYSIITRENLIKAKDQILKIIISLNFIDFSQIEKIINNDDLGIRKYGLQILNGQKENYYAEDIERISNMILLIEDKFKEVGKREVKKKMLSSKEIEIWVCSCQKENDNDNEFCLSCNKDIFGFRKTETNHIETIKRLNLELEILKEKFTS